MEPEGGCLLLDTVAGGHEGLRHLRPERSSRILRSGPFPGEQGADRAPGQFPLPFARGMQGDAGGQGEVPGEGVPARPPEAIGDLQHPRLLQKAKLPPVDHGIGKAGKAVMLTRKEIRLGTGLPGEAAGRGINMEPEEPPLAEPVLFRPINHHGVVDRGGPEAIPRGGIRGVEETPGIHEEILAIGVQLETQQVVVLVVPDPPGPDRATGDEEVEGVLAHQVDAALGEGPTPGRWRRRSADGPRSPVEPERLFRASPGRGPEVLPIEKRPACRQQVTMVARIPCPVIGEDVEAPIVVVPHLGGQAVRLRVPEGELQHPLEPVPEARRQRDAVLLAEEGDGQEHLGHQPVIGNTGLVVSAVGMDLPFHFMKELVQGEPAPGLRLAEGRAGDPQAGEAD